jgi:hypothetical protein
MVHILVCGEREQIESESGEKCLEHFTGKRGWGWVRWREREREKEGMKMFVSFSPCPLSLFPSPNCVFAIVLLHKIKKNDSRSSSLSNAQLHIERPVVICCMSCLSYPVICICTFFWQESHGNQVCSLTSLNDGRLSRHARVSIREREREK